MIMIILKALTVAYKFFLCTSMPHNFFKKPDLAFSACFLLFSQGIQLSITEFDAFHSPLTTKTSIWCIEVVCVCGLNQFFFVNKSPVNFFTIRKDCFCIRFIVPHCIFSAKYCRWCVTGRVADIRFGWVELQASRDMM